MTTALCPSCFTWTNQTGETELVTTRRYVCPECERRWTLETDVS